jgi:hypothetical protein
VPGGIPETVLVLLDDIAIAFIGEPCRVHSSIAIPSNRGKLFEYGKPKKAKKVQAIMSNLRHLN